MLQTSKFDANRRAVRMRAVRAIKAKAPTGTRHRCATKGYEYGYGGRLIYNHFSAALYINRYIAVIQSDLSPKTLSRLERG